MIAPAKPSAREAASASRQKTFARNVVELQPDAVGILEQQRIISRCPLVLARRADDFRSKRDYEVVQFIDVGALAGAETQMVQTDAILLECRPGVSGQRPADPYRASSAESVILHVSADYRLPA